MRNLHNATCVICFRLQKYCFFLTYASIFKEKSKLSVFFQYVNVHLHPVFSADGWHYYLLFQLFSLVPFSCCKNYNYWSFPSLIGVCKICTYHIYFFFRSLSHDSISRLNSSCVIKWPLRTSSVASFNADCNSSFISLSFFGS